MAVLCIIIVVSPLNALINDQISRLNSRGIKASVIDAKKADTDELETDGVERLVCDLHLSDKTKLECGYYNIVFAHPESLVSSTYGRKLIQSKPYQDNVSAIVVDKAHCILEW